MKILILKMKHGDYFVSASTDAEEARAYLHLFKLMDTHSYYASGLDNKQRAWHTAAMEGDAKAAQRLLRHRSDHGCKYEELERVTVIKP